MTEIVNTATIRVEVDAENASAGFRPVVEGAQQATQAVAAAGASASAASRSLENAQRNIIAAIQRTTTAMEAGGKTTAAYYEAIGNQRGVDPAVLAPYISQLRALEEAQARAAQAATTQQAAQQQAAESARVEAAAQRQLAQAQASRDNFVQGLREQVALYGASAEEILRYRAAQVGATQAAEPLIAQLQSLRSAQEQANQAAQASAEAAREQAAAQRELAQAQAARDNFVAGLREQIALFGASTEEVLRYRAAQAGASQESAHLILQLQNMRAAQEQVTQAARAQAEAERAAAQVQNNQNSFITSLQQEVEAIGRTRTELLELRAAQLGVTNQAAPLIARLRESSQSMSEGGMSAAAMAAAMRQVPAQLTDIIVGLQGGQAPITVLFQQGGQLRDMFGSIGGAARALGSAVLNLVTPWTLTIAAVGALTYAFKVGHDETIEYGRAIALSGNLAGTTTGQMSDMARSIGLVAGSQHEAASAITELVNTSAVANGNLQKFGTVAVQAQQVLGKSVADTAAEFAQLGRSPLNALQQIDEKYHFITASTYAQVKAAQEQGRSIDAANIAQNAFADGISKQRQKVLDSLTDWERGWIRIKAAVSGSVDAVIDFASGRDKGPAEKIKQLQDERDEIEARLDRQKKRSASRDGASYDASRDPDVLAIEAELDANKRAINVIRDKAKMSQDAATSAAATTRGDELRKKWLDDQNVLLTRQQMLQRDLQAAQVEGQANGLSDEEIQNRLLVIRRQYNDVYVQGIEASITALNRRAELQNTIDQRALASIQAQQALGNISEGDAINQAAQVELAALDRQKKVLQDQLGLVRTKINSQQEQADLEGQIANVAEQRRNREKQQQNDLLLLVEKRRQASEALYISGVTSATGERDELLAQVKAQVEYGEEIGLSATQVAELKAARLQNLAALKDETAASLEAIEPGNAVAVSYREQAQALRDLGRVGIDNAAQEQMVSNWKESVSQYDQVFQQGFADMLNEGRDGWSSFTKSLVTTFKTSVADELYKMFARPFVVQMVGNFLGVSQTAIAGEIASKQSVFGGTGGGDAGSAIGAAQAASSLYKAVTGGFDSLSSSVADAVQLGFDKTGLSGMFDGAAQSYDLATGIPANGAYAGMAGTAAAYGAGLLGGHYIGNAVAGDYSVAHGQTVTNIATAVGAYLLGPIGGVVGGVVGGLVNRAFGLGGVIDQGMKGTLSATALTGESYSTRAGGWFRSDKTDTKAFTDAIVAQFTGGLQSLEAASAGFASALGVSSDSIKDYSKVFDIKTTGDAAKDQQAISDLFGSIGNELAKKLIPNLDEFSKSGETASAALERLAGDFKGTDQVAQLLGFSASQLFGSTGLESTKAREQLIDFAGGLSTLGQQASAFSQSFLTNSEKLAPVAAALDKALASMGLETIPATRDEFKGLVNDLIASGAAATAEGAKRLESLLAIADVFAQVHPDETSDLLQIQAQTYDLLNDKVGAANVLQKQHILALEGMSPAMAAATQKLWDLQAAADAIDKVKSDGAALLNNVDNAFSVFQGVVGREKDLLQKRIDKETDAVSKLKSLSDSIGNTIDGFKIPGTEVAARQSAQSQIKAALSVVRGGGTLTDDQVKSLQKAFSTVTEDASTQFGSYQDYLRDLYQTKNDVVDLGKLTDGQLSAQETQLDLDKKQLEKYDAMLASAQEQVNVLKGISTTGLSIENALTGLQTAILSARGNASVAGVSAINQAYQSSLGRAPDSAGLEYWQDKAASGVPISDITQAIATSAEATIQGMYKTMLGHTADAAGLQFWLQQAKSGTSLADIGNAIAGSPEAQAKALHPFAVGTNEVPDTMAALIHKGERIIPAADNRALMARLASPSGNSDALAAEVKMLRETVAKQQAALDRIAINTGEHKDMFDSATSGGRGALLVEVAT